MTQIEIIAEEFPLGRLDKFVAGNVADVSRAQVQRLIDQEAVLVDGIPAKNAKQPVKIGQVIVLTIPEAVDAAPVPEAIPLDIVFEDEHMLVINKAAGMVVHPAVGNYTGTLVNALLHHCGDTLSGIGGVKRPGIVHRLDKETSGLMVVAKHDKAHRGLSDQLSDRSLSRTYVAFVWGLPNPMEGAIEGNIGRSTNDRKKMAVLPEGEGKEAITLYKTLAGYAMAAAKVQCKLTTGRTHQIRVHMSSKQHWLIGDRVYGRQRASGRRSLDGLKLPEEQREWIMDFPRQALHAAEISFIHPVSGEKMSFTADMPEDMQHLEKALQGNLL